jgi:type III secretory pathway component EscT
MSEQFQNLIENQQNSFGIVQTLWYFVGFLIDFRIVQTLWYFVGFLLDFGIVQSFWHFVGLIPKLIENQQNTTMSEQFQNLIENQQIPQCLNNSKIY